MSKAGMEHDAEIPTVNRNAVVLEPAEAYLEWAKQCFGDEPDPATDHLREEGTVYLIPEVPAEPDSWLKRNFAAMFENELMGWCTDESLWPKDRSFKAFRKLFNIRFCSVVHDMGKGSVEKDEV